MQCGDALLERLRKVLQPEYTVERSLGGGGMGCVYLGHDLQLKRQVAIKVLRPEMAIAELAQRFVLEAQNLARLSHPNIVQIYLAGERGGLSFFIMEYLGDTTLADRLRQAPLAPPELLALGRGLLAGLGEAHRHQIVHRDVKPTNIFVTGTGRVVLTDFGIARREDSEDEPLTATGRLGPSTPHFCAPEQAIPGAPVGAWSDLYSAGVVVYEAGTGRDWLRETDLRKVDWAGLPPAMAGALRRALEVNPVRRWRDAKAFAQSLDRTAWSSRSAAVVAAAVVLVAAAALLLPHDRCRPGSIRPGCQLAIPHTDLALLPFKASITGTGPDGSEFAHAVTTSLSWFHRIRIASAGTVGQQVGRDTAAELEQTQLRALNSRFIASGLFVGGGDRWLLQLTVRDGQAEPFATINVPGAPERFLEWSCDAADSLVHRAFPERWQEYRALRPSSCASGNLQAYREFFLGDSAFQLDAYNTARDHFARALQFDSSFVNAAWQLALVRRFLRAPFEADLKRIYDQHRAELPLQYARLIEAMLDPDLRNRFARYRAVAADFPDDGYVGFVYADELFHRGPLVGIPLDSALAEFHRTIAIDSTLHWMSAWDHLLYGYLRLGLRDRSDSARQARNAIPATGEPDDATRRALFRLAYHERFQPALGGVEIWWLGLTLDSAKAERLNHFVRLGTSFDIPDTQRHLSEMLTRLNRTAPLRSNGFRALGIALLTLGRPGVALPMLDSAVALFGAADSLIERAEWRVMPGVYGLEIIADSERQWGLATMHRLANGSAGPIAGRAAWALAADAYARGDTSAAATLVAKVQKQSGYGLRRLLDASSEAARGRFRVAIELTDPMLGYDSATAVFDPFARSLLYLRRSQWFLALGDSAAADRARLWYQNSDSGIDGWPQFGLESSDVDNLLGVYARLLQAEADVARNRTAEACPLLARVREIWSDVEPVFVPLRERADLGWKRCRQ